MKLRALTLATLLSLTLAAPAAHANTKEVLESGHGVKVMTKAGACVRTKWQGSNDACGTEKAEPAPAPMPEPAPYVAPPAPKPVVQAPPPPPAPVKKTVIKKEARTIYFDSGKSVVSPAGEKKLDQLADVLKDAKDVRKVNIVGYADPMGKKHDNYALSERRAEAVAHYLNKRGYMNTAVAKTKGVGADYASADCRDKKKKAQKVNCLLTDRKVEIEIVYTDSE